jgi:hypothetical protein
LASQFSYNRFQHCGEVRLPFLKQPAHVFPVFLRLAGDVICHRPLGMRGDAIGRESIRALGLMPAALAVKQAS